jgi:2,4-dienoyl-CoA reductase-like NADH-dependent reductase (Old Yellow Enzyme family)
MMRLLGFLLAAGPRVPVLSSPTHKAEIRRLGEAIHKSGGHPGMQMAYYTVQAMWALGFLGGDHTENDFHPRELEMAWDGIGLWRD